MKPQNSDFNSYIYILYYQSNILYYLAQTGHAFRIFRIQSYLTEVLEQPIGGTPALNVMAIRGKSHANVSKQNGMLLASVDVAPPQGAV